jgi:hypothetical protein
MVSKARVYRTGGAYNSSIVRDGSVTETATEGDLWVATIKN